LGSLRPGAGRRGDITVWVSPDAVAGWRALAGRRTFSDAAIEAALMVRAVYRLALRQAKGLVASIFALLGLAFPLPDCTSRLAQRRWRTSIAASLHAADAGRPGGKLEAARSRASRPLAPQSGVLQASRIQLIRGLVRTMTMPTSPPTDLTSLPRISSPAGRPFR
jgi:hypothetical protein